MSVASIRVRTQHFVQGQRSANVDIIGLDLYIQRARLASDYRYSARELLSLLLAQPLFEHIQLGDYKRDGIYLFWLES